MSLQSLARMIVAPAAVAVAVGIFLWPLGPAAVILAVAAFLLARLVVAVQTRRQLDAAKRRLAANRARRQRLRRRV